MNPDREQLERKEEEIKRLKARVERLEESLTFIIEYCSNARQMVQVAQEALNKERV